MRNLRLVLLSFILLIFVNHCFAQWDPSFSQYMNNQLCINPAYTGVRNTIATNVNVKKQWLGVDGSPTTYLIGINAPINKSLSAVGGLLSNNNIGPVNSYNGLFSYAHLVKLNDQLHLSLGLNVGANYQNISLSKIDVVSSNDPMFQSDISNQINADMGAGAFLFSSTFYVGLSFPHLIETKFSEYKNIEVPTYLRSAYLSSGIVFNLNEMLALKPSTLFKMDEDKDMNLDLNMLITLNKKITFGASYRLKHTMAFIVNTQISKQLLVGYSYDINKSANSIGKNSHEISICFDSFKYTRKNHIRNFKKKKKKEKEKEDSIRSIRHF